MRPIALITGGSRGIGAATAESLARTGYDVCLSYVADEARAAHMVAACERHGARAVAVRADVGVPEDVAKLFEACDRLGPIALLVNNAGIIGQATPVADLDDAVLRRTFEVNLFGAVYCARAAIWRMSTARGGEGGVIVNISSIAATTGSPGEYVHYAASKAALDTFTLGLAREVGPEGIRVNAVQAGTTRTEIHATAGNPERPTTVARTAPLRRVAEPDDIAQAVLWLASDKAAYATGAILRIGGGL